MPSSVFFREINLREECINCCETRLGAWLSHVANQARGSETLDSRIFDRGVSSHTCCGRRSHCQDIRELITVHYYEDFA